MGARTGQEYIDALNERPIRVEVEGSATHRSRRGDPPVPQCRPHLCRAVRPPARVRAPGRPDLPSRRRPATRSGSSHLQPASTDDVVRRREAMRVWAEHSLGNLGRTGRLLLERRDGDGRGCRLVRPGRPSLRGQRPRATTSTCGRTTSFSRTRSSSRRPTGRSRPRSRRRRHLRRASSTRTTTGS